MSSLFRSAFFVCTVYCSLLQAMSPSVIALAPFLVSEQFACIRDQLHRLHPMGVPVTMMLLEASRQREARNFVQERGIGKTYAVLSNIFSGIKWFSGLIFAGAVFLKNNVGSLASFFGKSDVQLGALAVVAAGGFMYLRSQVAQVQVTQADHTNRLQGLQTASSTIIATLGLHGGQLGNLETSVSVLIQGQERLEDGVQVAKELLNKLHTQVGENSATLQGVSSSVQNLVARLSAVEDGVGALNSSFAGLQLSFNETNEMLHQRFKSFDSGVSGLSNRVDDGFTKVDQLRLLLEQSVIELRTLVGENSTHVGGTINDMQDELQRLSGVLDAKAMALESSIEQLDANAQARNNVLRNDMKQSVSSLDRKLDQLIAASSSHAPPLQYRPGPEVFQVDAFPAGILYARKQSRTPSGLPSLMHNGSRNDS